MTKFVLLTILSLHHHRYLKINRQAPVLPPTRDMIARHVHTCIEGSISSGILLIAWNAQFDDFFYFDPDYLTPPISTATELWIKKNLHFFAW